MTAPVPLLASVGLNLRITRGGPLPPSPHRAAHALFLDLVERADPALAKTLHDADDLKPFASFPIRLRTRIGEEGERFVEAESAGRWRIGCLSEPVLAALLAAVGTLELSREPLSFGGAAFEIRRRRADPNTTTTPAQLLAAARLDREITVEFLSPTSFRRQGRQLLFPEPALVFASWLRRWEALGVATPSEDVREVLAKEIFTARYRLETRLTDFGEYKIAGFQGVITYELHRSVSEEVVRWANALADFALFAGTGYKTTMGLGETRRIRA
jgi:CRISPR-associated endoribonuclease Cas6